MSTTDDDGEAEDLEFEIRFPFVREEDSVVVGLQEYEIEVLGNLLVDLRHLLMADSHEALRRLKPPAHADNAEAEQAYRELVDDDLLRGRLDMLDVVEETMAGASLDDAGVAAWMQTLNNMRLVLGERLELNGAGLESHDLPDGPATFLYEWIAELLEFLVRAAMPGLAPGHD